MLSKDKFYDKKRLLNRLKARTKYTEDGHWLWIGKITKHGRGVMQVGGVKGKDIEIHRVSAYVHHNLDLKDTNSHALHKPICRYKNCWNPEHLYVGTHTDNMRDERKELCIRGHDLFVLGSVKRDGSRYCRECRRLRVKKKRKQEQVEKIKKENKTCVPF